MTGSSLAGLRAVWLVCPVSRSRRYLDARSPRWTSLEAYGPTE